MSGTPSFNHELAVRAWSLMNSGTAQRIGFSELREKLRDQVLIQTFENQLKEVFHLTALGWTMADRTKILEKVKIRVFLSSFMIAFHQDQAFEEVRELENELIDAAKAMLSVFDKLCDALRALPDDGNPAVAVNDALQFPVLLHTYLKAFYAWKRSDEEKLAGRIKHALSALYQAEAHLEESDPETPALRADFQGQQARLRVKLLQIAGEKALQEVDASRVQGAGGSLPPGTAVEGGGEGAYSALPKRVTNEQLAHELLLDPAFTLDENGGCGGGNPVHSKIRLSFHVAFWESLADDLRLSPPCYARVVKVLGEVRDGIADLAQGSAARRGAASINDVLDMDLIKQQIDRGGFAWTSCVKLIQDVASILTQVEAAGARPAGAPAGHDPAAKVRWEEVDHAMQAAAAAPAEQPGAFCAALSYLLDRVRAVRIDVANSRLRLIAPVIKVEGVEYLQEKFKEKFPKDALELERTCEWLRAAVREEVAAERITVEDLAFKNENKSAAFLMVLHAAFATLVTGATAPLEADCPETLLLAVPRLGAFNAAFHAGVRAAAVLVLVAQRLKDAQEGNPAPLLEKVAQRLLAAPAGDANAAADAAVDALRECEAMDEPKRAELREALLQGIGSDRSVPRLMEARLRNALRRPDAGAADIFRDVPATLAAYRELQLPAAARPLAPYIRDVVQGLRRVVHLSKRVHAHRYNAILEDIGENFIKGVMDESANPSEGSETPSKRQRKH